MHGYSPYSGFSPYSRDPFLNIDIERPYYPIFSSAYNNNNPSREFEQRIPKTANKSPFESKNSYQTIEEKNSNASYLRPITTISSFERGGNERTTSLLYSPSYQQYNNSSYPSYSGNIIEEKKSENQNFTVIGFNNLGNSCYLNSCMQCFIHIEKVLNYFMNANINQNTPIAFNLQHLIKRMDEINHLVGCNNVSPSTFRSMILSKRPDLNNYQQNDAIEFLSLLFECLNEELNRNAKKSEYVEIPDLEINDKELIMDLYQDAFLSKTNSIITEIFQGLMSTRVVCDYCNYTSYSYDPFFMLHLDFEKNLSISKCIENSYKFEKLDENNKYLCKKCNKKQTCLKASQIEIFPEVLIIHLKRFIYNGYYSTKKDYNIKIDSKLEFIINENQGNKEINEYNLVSIINHYGTLEMGHYTAYCKDIVSNKFYYFNDDKVSLIHDFGNEESQNAYIIFYQKINTPVLL